MHKRSLTSCLVVTMAVALLACKKEDKVGTTHITAGEYNVNGAALSARDQNGPSTPKDQSNEPSDLETTRRIRQALVLDDSLSNDAKNVRVTTARGTVTLRGPVRSEDERRKLEAKAFPLVGSNRLDDAVEVQAQ